MCQLFETILIREGVPHNIFWHAKRMRHSSLALFGHSIVPDLPKVLQVPEKYRKGDVRCRIIYGKNIEDIQFTVYEKKKISTLKLIESNGADYPHKTTDRKMLDQLFSMRGDCDDILIVKDGFVTDTSIANILFTDGIRWYTPENPLLRGTCRERMLFNQAIIPACIRVSDIHRYSGFKVINALRSAEEHESIPVSNIR